MDPAAPAIVVAARPHGEHAAVVRFLTETDGVVAGYVAGGRSRAKRPVLQPGNAVAVAFHGRAGALARAEVELTQSRAALALDRTAAAAVGWLTALVATVIDERVPCPRLHAGLAGVLAALDLAVAAGHGPEVALAGVARFELLLLAELGFGLDLSTCAATGEPAATADLAFVSPRSSHAVGRAAGTPYAAKLLPLPPFLLAGGPATPADVAAGLGTTGWFLERDVLTGRAAGLADTRNRLVTANDTAVASLQVSQDRQRVT